MKNTKKALILMLVSLLAFNVFLISASAYIEPETLIDVDVNLEVGTYSGAVFTPLAPGTALHQNDIITVRIAPTSNFLCGTTRYPVMYTKAYFEVVGTGNAAFTLNTENSFYQACSGLSGTASAAGLPESAWPAALKSVGAGGNGTFTTNTAIAVNNNAGPSAPNGGYPMHLPGDWLFRFNLKVKQDIPAGSGAKVWMSGEWLRKPSYPTGQLYFTKCLDSEQISGLGKSNAYNYNLDISDANINLEPASNVNITFDANGGTGGTGPTVMQIGAPLTAPVVSREGYTLTGWSPAVPPSVPSADATYTAQWSIDSFTISFDESGGSEVTDITQEYGTTVTAPADPVREGYTFEGWIPAVPPVMPADNIECVAQWAAMPTSTITFDLNGGTSAPIDPITLYEGAPVTAPADPTRENYTFAGWLPAVPAIMPADDVACVAKWIGDSYTLTFDANGGTGGTGPTVTEFGTAISAPAVTRTGYTFAGWDPAVAPTMPAADTTYTAKWTINSYIITWDANGGSGGGSNSCDYGAMPSPVNAGTRAGYSFTGWSPEIIAATGPATYTAQWSINPVSITFDANGGTGGTGPTIMTPGDPLTAPTVVREGYVLAGWLPVLPATVPSSDTTYVAQWVRTFVVCTKTPGGMVVNIQGWTADSQYQIWSYQDVTSDFLLDDTSKQADQWILSMPYTAGSSGEVQPDGSINFTVPNFVSSTANYIIAVRIADADDNFVKEIRDAYTPEDVSEVVITKVLVDGMVTTGYELKEITGSAETLIKVIGNNVPGIVYTATQKAGPTALDLEVSNTNEFLWDISVLEPGIYVVELTATNGATTDVEVVTFELYSLSPGIEYASIDDMTVTYNAGVASITPTFADGTFSYRVREPGRPAQYRSVEYPAPGTFQYAITAPGVYNIGGYSTRAGLVGTEYSFDDGLIRTLVVPRTGGGGGGVTMTFTANQPLPDVAKGTPIVLTATATGLPGPVEYSFWRYDATGYVLVQDWSTDNTLNWTPARVGEYSFEARAKGNGAGSYEIKKSLGVNITDTVDEIAAVTGITINEAYLNANAQAKKPIIIQANAAASNGDDLLYKFMVYDDDMKNQQLKDYSVAQHCVWTPREAGNYIIMVMVKNDESFGRYDEMESFDITVD